MPLRSKKPRHFFIWVVIFLLCGITYGELKASPVAEHSTVIAENSKRIKILTECGMFALSSGRMELVTSYEHAIDKYGPSYEQIIIYYSARAEGFMVGVTYARIGKEILTDAESSKLLQITANSLYLKFCPEQMR